MQLLVVWVAAAAICTTCTNKPDRPKKSGELIGSPDFFLFLAALSSMEIDACRNATLPAVWASVVGHRSATEKSRGPARSPFYTQSVMFGRHRPALVP